MKMKGVLAAILTAVLCISSTVWAYSDGDGSPENPYQIANKADLLALAADTDNYDKCFILTANIDLAGESFTEAVIAPDIYPFMAGFQGPEFIGVFDGNGHTISNLTITCTDRDCVGLFGYFSSGGQIKNLGAVNVNIQGANRVGGLVGQNWDGTLTSCYATGSVSGTDNGIGGLVGGNYGPINSCYATASVSGKTGIGGLVGEGGGAITSCYATGAVSGTDRNIGGLTGWNEGPINSCYATGTVSGTGWFAGGLVGENYGSVTSCFWDVWTSGQSSSSGGKGLTTEQMKTVTIYQNAGWAGMDWVMNDSVDYPRLNWEGTGYAAIPSAVIPFAGSGTEADPYRITTAYEFSLLNWYSGVLDKQIKLQANLDLSGITLYPIGDLGSFTGVFDGNGHTISNATILMPDSDYVGLFASLGNMDNSGQIKNFGIVNINIQGKDNVGGLVGYSNGGTITSCYLSGLVSGVSIVGGLVGYNASGTIESCHTTGTISQTNPLSAAGGLVGANDNGTLTSCDAAEEVNGTGYYVGGLVGDNLNGTITSCHATGTVNGDNSYTGGLVGHMNQGTITSCYATGAVSTTGFYGVGGLVGGSWDGLITLCHATGTVSGNYNSGGLVGLNNYTTIESCYATGAVNGAILYIGGLVGNSAGTITSCYAMGAVSAAGGADYVGGLIGYNGGNNITSCYATGLVSATNVHVGGLVGYVSYGTFTSCFWDTQTSNRPTSAGGTGKTTAQMKTLSTFTDAGWNFASPGGTWMMLRPGQDYPRLAWQTIIAGDIAGVYGVNYIDFAVFAAHWEQTGCPAGCGNADINNSGTVDITDLMLFADNWLKGI